MTPFWSYYDWAITGVNCFAYLCSKEDKVTRLLKNLPIIAVSYEIQQNKSPVYGYADTGARSILRGQRVVAGELILAHREVGELEKVLRDSKRALYNTSDKLDLKEELRLKYWNTRNWETTFKDPQRKNFANEADQYNIFYAHPSFDISIVYGVGDEVAVNSQGYPDLRYILGFKSEWHTTTSGDSSESFKDVNPLYRPPQDRLDRSKQRETISGVQLVGKRKQIAADGEIIVEAYSFLAIDVLNQ